MAMTPDGELAIKGFTQEQIAWIETKLEGWRYGDAYAVHNLLYKERPNKWRVVDYVLWSRRKRGPYATVHAATQARLRRERRAAAGLPIHHKQKITDEEFAAYYDEAKYKALGEELAAEKAAEKAASPRYTIEQLCKAARMYEKDLRERPLMKHEDIHKYLSE